MRMKRLKSGIAAFVAAMMSVMMLTACSGGGGGGGGTPAAPVTPSAFSNTKTYQLAQSGKGKSIYAEYWNGETNSKGEFEQYPEQIIKEGTQNGSMYADLYDKGNLTMTVIVSGGKQYGVLYCGTSPYTTYTEVAKMGGAEIPEGKNVYVDVGAANRIESGDAEIGTGSSAAGADISKDLAQIDETKMTASTGTYTIPGTSQTYYAEIFTSKANPKQSATYAYDKNDELKALVTVDDDDVTALFFNKFEFDSSMFKAAKLNVASYNAMDITAAYIAGIKKLG